MKNAIQKRLEVIIPQGYSVEMIIKAQCEHCEFEDEGLEKTVFCPVCGKETHILPKGSSFAPIKTVPADEMDGTIAAGYACAILLPVIGFFMGVYLAIKGQTGHGVAAMALSCIASSIWFFVFLRLA
jgi:hypothetical protein